MLPTADNDDGPVTRASWGATGSAVQAAQQVVVDAVAAVAAPGLVAGDHQLVPTLAVVGPPTEEPLDAGALSVTRTGVVLGTVAYIAPEVLSSSTASPLAADLFSFGIVAWELYAGRRPFNGPAGAIDFAEAATHNDPSTRLGSGCAEFDDLVRRCLFLAPAARPTALEAMQQIEIIAAQRGIPIRS